MRVFWLSFFVCLATFANAQQDLPADNLELIRAIRNRILANPQQPKTEAEMRDYEGKITGKVVVPYTMIAIRGGEFLMGSPDSERERRADEGPRRLVKVAPFWMGKTEVTWKEADQFIVRGELNRRAGQPLPADLSMIVSGPSIYLYAPNYSSEDPRHPASQMSQHAASKYCQWLSSKTGHYYRLPTEAEWEYACRAGSNSAYSFGDDTAKLGDHAWYYGNSGDSVHPAGLKQPNAWGLHDMHGNVMELVLDQYSPDSYRGGDQTVPATKLYPRVARGGSWYDDPVDLRSAARLSSNAKWHPSWEIEPWWMDRGEWLGFRIVRPLEVPSLEEMDALWNSQRGAR